MLVDLATGYLEWGSTEYAHIELGFLRYVIFSMSRSEAICVFVNLALIGSAQRFPGRWVREVGGVTMHS